MDSNRFPGKPLAMAAGKPLLEWTWLQAKKTKADYVWITTPDREIGRFCQTKGILWRPSSKDCPTGTHRCAEFMDQLTGPMAPSIDVIVNWQVDSPLVNPLWVDKLIKFVRDRRDRDLVGTLVHQPGGSWGRIGGLDEDKNVVKVAISKGDTIHPKDQNRCYWFSRASMFGSMAHIGIYCCNRFTLGDLGWLTPTRLSKVESLEQLAWIERGVSVFGIEVDEFSKSIDSPEDWEEFKRVVE